MNAPQAGLIGRSIERREDYRFLTGQGQYTDDVVMPHQTYAYFLRSPHAHAKITSINTAAGTPGGRVVSRDWAVWREWRSRWK